MNYKWLWAIAILFIFLDFGTTVYMMQMPEFHEGNPVVVNMMDTYGELGGLLLSVVLRLGAVCVGMLWQDRVMSQYKWLLPLLVLPAFMYPAIWNTYLYIVTIIL